MQPPVLGHERASHGGEHCLPPVGQREKEAQCPVSRAKAHSVRPLGHMQRPESKLELRRGHQRGLGVALGLSEAGAGLPGSASPTPPHSSPQTPQVPFKTDIRSQPFSRMQNPPVELHPTELNILVSSVASPHLIWPWPPLLPDVMSYHPYPSCTLPHLPGSVGCSRTPRASAPVTLSAWNALPDTFVARSLASLRSLHKCHLIHETPQPLLYNTAHSSSLSIHYLPYPDLCLITDDIVLSV